MENTTGPIKPFLAGKLPKKKYTDLDEFASDLASILAIEQERIVIELINLPDIKGEKGDPGERGLQGLQGTPGGPGSVGPAGPAGTGLRYLGDWSVSSISYSTSDVVLHNSVYYVAHDAHVSSSITEPGIGADWDTVWDVLDATFIGQDGISFIWQSDWLTATTYNANDVVANGGSVYMCILGHLSAGTNEPGAGVDTATYWDLMMAPSTVSVTAFDTLTDAAPVVWPGSATKVHNNATVTITASRTLSLTGWTSGMRGTLKIVQGGAGSNTITLPAGSKTPGGTGATLSTGVGDIDVLHVFYDGTNYFWTVELDFA